MSDKNLTLEEYINIVYNDFLKSKIADDFNQDELIKWLLFDIKSGILNAIYDNRKGEYVSQNSEIKKILERIVILTKINNINLAD